MRLRHAKANTVGTLSTLKKRGRDAAKVAGPYWRSYSNFNISGFQPIFKRFNILFTSPARPYANAVQFIRPAGGDERREYDRRDGAQGFRRISSIYFASESNGND
jgi:hypothetical protein